MLRRACVALVVFTGVAHADPPTSDAWPARCAAELKRSLAADPSFADVAIASRPGQVTVEASGAARLTIKRFVRARYAGNLRELVWRGPTGKIIGQPARPREGCPQDPTCARDLVLWMETVGASAYMTGEKTHPFADVIKPGVGACLESAGSIAEAPTLARWRVACLDGLRRAVDKASARDRFFDDPSLEQQEGAITVSWKGGRYSLGVAVDVPATKELIDAWAQAMADCQDDHTRCSLVRTSGYAGFVVAGDEHRRAFTDHLEPALRACMPSPPAQDRR